MLDYHHVSRRLYRHTIPTTTGKAIVEGLQKGNWRGTRGVACCPAHPDKTPSLSVTERSGRVLVHCMAGCPQQDVIDALRDLGLWHDRPPPQPVRHRRHSRPRPTPIAVPVEPDGEPPLHELDAGTRDAVRIWRSAGEIPNTPAWRYLERRGLADCLPSGVLRYTREQHPHHPGHDIPALVVARHSPRSGLVRGVLLVFLEEDGRKCRAVEKAKISLGGSGMNLRAELFFGGLSRDLAIAEGVESAIAAAKLFDCPSWATCGSFPSELRLPSFVKHVTIVADHDPSGVSVARGKVLQAFIQGTGRTCRGIYPPMIGWDANDYLLGRPAREVL